MAVGQHKLMAAGDWLQPRAPCSPLGEDHEMHKVCKSTVSTVNADGQLVPSRPADAYITATAHAAALQEHSSRLVTNIERSVNRP